MAFSQEKLDWRWFKTESRQVHVAAGENYAQLWKRAIAALRQPRLATAPGL